MARVMGVEVTLRHEGHTEEYIRVSHHRSRRCGIDSGSTPGTPFDDGVRRLHQFLLEERDGASQSA